MVTTRKASGKLPPRSPTATRPVRAVRSPSPQVTSPDSRYYAGRRPADESSSEFEYDDEEEAVGSVKSNLSTAVGSVKSNLSTGSRRERLPLNVEKQLLIDIEGEGGIAYFDKGKAQALRTILDQRPGIYGNRADKIRRRIGQRVEYLKSKLDRTQYLQLLAKYQVQPFRVSSPKPTAKPAAKEQAKAEQAKVEQAKKQEISDLEDSDNEEDWYNSASIPRAERPPSTITTVTMSDRMTTIEVNVHVPEDNREVFVIPLDNVDGVEPGTLYHGYWILLPIDIRWTEKFAEDEPWKARVSGDESIIIRIPSWSFSMLFDRDEMEQLENDGEIDPRCMVGLDAARHAYTEKQARRKWKHIQLNFPRGHQLSAKVLNKDAGENHELEFEVIPFEGDGEDTGAHHFGAWKVANLELGPRKKGKIEEKETKTKAQLLKERWARKKAARSIGEARSGQAPARPPGKPKKEPKPDKAPSSKSSTDDILKDADVFEYLDSQESKPMDWVEQGNNVISGKKRSHDEANAPPEIAVLVKYASLDNPVHVIQMLPRNVQEILWAYKEGEHRNYMLNLYLNKKMASLSQAQQEDISLQPTEYEKFLHLKHHLTLAVTEQGLAESAN